MVTNKRSYLWRILYQLSHQGSPTQTSVEKASSLMRPRRTLTHGYTSTIMGCAHNRSSSCMTRSDSCQVGLFVFFFFFGLFVLRWLGPNHRLTTDRLHQSFGHLSWQLLAPQHY
ncbi:unnamed protein product [Rangifer tarandus platyrhynchus]|uniref:Uncharacterized protein n=1 Tax=Rangifer tarandus platyrhynchus TaxID=3082113 RepID=A0AC59YFL5_RANTA